MSKISILGIGHPLLDITANVTSQLLKKYNLKPNAVILGGPEHCNLCEDLVANFDVKYIAGGSTQNSIRYVQWVLSHTCGHMCKVAFVGCVGDDKYSQIMREKAESEGVKVDYVVDNSISTGTCAVMLTENGLNRSLCAFLGAAKLLNKHHIAERSNYLIDANIVYCAGFVLTSSFDAVCEVVEHIKNNPQKLFALNLSAPYICLNFADRILKILPYVDILFGNETEAIAFANVMDWKTEKIDEIILKIHRLISCPERRKLVVITQGAEPVVVATRTEKIIEYPVARINEKCITDTNGAGDAFVGGFLAQYVQDKTLSICVRCGIYCASEIIQLSGCTIPESYNFKI